MHALARQPGECRGLDIVRIEAEVTLNASADVITGLGLLTDLLTRPPAPLDYEFNAEIDLGALYPALEVQRSGAIALGLN